MLLIQVNLSRSLLLQEITSNPGILPIKKGNAAIAIDEFVVFKLLDLKSLYEDLTFNIDKYDKFDLKIISDYGKDFNVEFVDCRKQVNYVKNETIKKFTQIIPISIKSEKRQKRGLINPLGSLIKLITGNLDHEDAIKYEKMITNIKSHENLSERKISSILNSSIILVLV